MKNFEGVRNLMKTVKQTVENFQQQSVLHYGNETRISWINEEDALWKTLKVIEI